MAGLFSYSRAIVCGIPSSLCTAALRQNATLEPVNLDLAREQHKQFVTALQNDIGLDIIHLKEDENFPDCVFVEDPVVVCQDTALITVPGHESRQGEAKRMKREVASLGLKVVEMKHPGIMDGGDVLFTGREFFVGISTRTNEEGLSQLAKAFPNYHVTAIPVEAGLHLKSFCSIATPDVIAIGSSQAAKSACDIITVKGKYKYNFLTIPDDIAANCVYANNILIHASFDAFPNSSSKFDQLDCKKIPLSATELNKVDGCFTCCAVLVP